MARKILLADDSVTAQNMGRKILADAGYEVITVNNGSAALKRISEQRPDVIVLDVYMPGYSGLEVCQRLKEVGETARIPILLTVGKLEPFKPEEVKRVRADAFIVKPFEASELLSALSKLEDRVVPRAEASKPGRFAKAAMEQVPYDKTMAIEEDTSWKNRITFPSKKKEKEAEPDEPVYPQASKDLQSVIEKKLAEVPVNRSAVTNEEERLDLGALAPAGLPKDVTPEEIAALAAAAAQMQGRIAEGRYVPPSPDAETPKVEFKEDLKPIEPPKQEPVASPVAAEAIVEAKPAEPVEAKEAEAQAPASFADQILVSAHAERPYNEDSSSSANGSLPKQGSEAAQDEPVTMAVATVAEPRVQASRWTAVAVALAPEEAAISLEQEMQKSYAVFVPAGNDHAAEKSEPSAVGPIDQPIEAHEAVVPDSATAVPVAPDAQAMTTGAEKLEAGLNSLAEDDARSTDLKSDLPRPNTSVGAVEKPIDPTPVAAPVIAESATAIAEVEPAPKPSDKTEESIVAERSEDRAVIESEAVSVVANEHSQPEAEHKPDLAALAAAALTELKKSEESTGTPADSSEPKAGPLEMAAKAVAVGAESRPEDVTPSDSDSDSVASIVDSVLADLRPKIVAEISKKLGKKK